MARGWHGNSAGHAAAGALGGRRSAEARRKLKELQDSSSEQFGEVIRTNSNNKGTKGSRSTSKTTAKS